MKLLYATSFEKTSGLANRFQVAAMARAFQKLLGSDFILGASDFDDSKKEIKIENFNTTSSSRLAWKILLFAKRNNVEVVYSREQNLLFFLIILNFLFFRLTIRFAYEVHTMQKTIRGVILDWFMAHTVLVHIFLTGHLLDAYSKKYKVKKERMIVAHDGVEVSLFDVQISKDAARKKYGLPLDKKIIGYFGRFKTMDMDKGISDILRALLELPADIIFLAMGGKKRDRDEYVRLAKELGVDQRMIFVEQFSQEILAEYQKAVDIFLMPFPWTEHFAYYMSPLKMFEYMASKRPIIASDLPSIREVLDEKKACIVEPSNPQSLAERIMQLIDDPKYAERISLGAYQEVQKYTWEKRVEKILNTI